VLLWPAARAIIGFLADVVRFGMLFFRSSSAFRAENLVLRRQLARYLKSITVVIESSNNDLSAGVTE
jgi:hypothetical protein